jgi:hypothetical protein
MSHCAFLQTRQGGGTDEPVPDAKERRQAAIAAVEDSAWFATPGNRPKRVMMM